MLLFENIKIATTQPIPASIDEKGEQEYFTPEEFKNFIRPVLNNYFGDRLSNVNKRFDIILTKVRSDGYEPIFEFDLVPIGKHTPEIAAPDNPLYSMYQQYSKGETGWRIFKTPKDAIDTIPEKEEWAYRGMSWEEWQSIRKNQAIQSNAGYNFSNQQSLTFYGNADTATFYSNSFAPQGFKASTQRPAVVIAVPKQYVLTHKDRPDTIPEGEFAHEGPLSSKHITAAWMLVPIKAKKGVFEIVFQWKRTKDKFGNYSGKFFLTNPHEGSRHSPTISTAIRKMY